MLCWCLINVKEVSMTNEIIFYTQVGSFTFLVFALFTLYRILVSQKDAAIEVLKEKNSFLEDKISDLKETRPDKLAKSLSERVKMQSDELERLSQDRDENLHAIKQKEKELHATQTELEHFKQQLDNAQEIASEFFCSYCKAPMVAREYHDVDYEGGVRLSMSILLLSVVLPLQMARKLIPVKAKKNHNFFLPKLTTPNIN